MVREAYQGMSIANLHKLQILGLVSEKLYNVYVYQYLFLKLALAVVFCINSLRDTCDYHVGCGFPNTYTRLKECLLRLKIFYKFTKISPMKEMPPWSLHRRASLSRSGPFPGQTSVSRVVNRSIKFPSISKGPSSSSPSNSGHYHSPHSSGGSNGVAGINRDSHNRSGTHSHTYMHTHTCSYTHTNNCSGKHIHTCAGTHTHTSQI